MLSTPTQSTHDLRSKATDRKRAKELKAKWQPAWAVTSDISTAKEGPNDTKRPLRQYSKRFPASNRLKNAKSVHRNSVEGKLDVLKGREEHQETGSSGSGSSSSASEPDQDEVFDYDRQGELEEHGQTILATALDKAVVKFEDNQTNMLIRNEYDIVDGDDIEKDDDTELSNEDDDYELI